MCLCSDSFKINIMKKMCYEILAINGEPDRSLLKGDSGRCVRDNPGTSRAPSSMEGNGRGMCEDWQVVPHTLPLLGLAPNPPS